MYIKDIQQQKIEWRKKGWTIPEFRGSKQDWFSLIVELLRLVEDGQASDLGVQPQTNIVAAPYAWRLYAPFLKGTGLVSNRAGVLTLTEEGLAFLAKPSKRLLADCIHEKFRLFGETLDILSMSSKTIEEVNRELCETFCLNWEHLNSVRQRMDWLEVLGLIQNVGNRKWLISDEGKETLSEWNLVTPDVLEVSEPDSNNIVITDPPVEIALLLQHLFSTPEDHKKRSTYNIWVPSPNRINNLRIIVQFALERVSKADLFKFVEDEFSLKTSSAESMLPFLKASGLLEEVGRNVYIATPAAKAWCETGNDLDFVRILHSNMRFVGEMIKTAETDSIRNDIYAQAKNYGLNVEKARWIAGFLLEAGLLEEPQYLHLKATPLGKQFVSTLPLFDGVLEDVETKNSESTVNEKDDTGNSKLVAVDDMFNRLHESSLDPMAFGKASGVAFEESIAEIFRYMGFDAKRVGGAGDTDVIVRWKDGEGKNVIAIVDGKSKSGGTVSHSDISDVAIDTHKDKNNADYVAIVGPGFSGDTIRNHARKKQFALITVAELIEIARNAHELGLSLEEIALIFHVPEGLSKLDELMAAKQREMDVITLVISTFGQEQEMIGNLSARDLYLLLRATSLSPSLEELMDVFDVLSKQEIGVLLPVKKASASENTTYMMNDGQRTVNRLRALASAIEKGLL